MNTETQIICRTRSNETAKRVAGELARLTGHCFVIRRFDARTVEVVPQRQGVPVRIINGYVRLATAIVGADMCSRQRISFKYFHDILQAHVRVTYRWVAEEPQTLTCPGNPAHPIIIEVERITDSGSIPLLGKMISDDDEELIEACESHQWELDYGP